MMPLVYWKYEITGRLSPIVQKYLDTNEELTPQEQLLFATYLKIWIDYDYAIPTCPDQYNLLKKLRVSWETEVLKGDRHTIEKWLEECLTIGIDPL